MICISTARQNKYFALDQMVCAALQRIVLIVEFVIIFR